MDAITDSLTPTQTSQLHEVADLLLTIYHTLARMRYLDPSWIQPGPHDLTPHLPLYTSLALDPSIIYLYHILPYIDPLVTNCLDFFDGGNFADFRDAKHVTQGRDPLWAGGEDEPAELLRPWMTPLSVMRNHRQVLVYDARRHAVMIFDQMNCGSCDRNLYEGAVFSSEGVDGRVRYFRKREDGGEEEVGVEEARQLGRGGEGGDENGEQVTQEGEENAGEEEEGGSGGKCEDEDEEGDEEEDEEEEEEENYWDERDARPAGDVLRDVNRWYHELVELPGGGENDALSWDPEVVKPLYRKHGWPGEDFDGDAFLLDKVRVEAAQQVKEHAEDLIQESERLKRTVEWRKEHVHGTSAMARTQERLTAAKTVDEEWIVRWGVWYEEQTTQHVQRNLERAGQRVASKERQRSKDLPLLELREVQINLSGEIHALERLKHQLADEQGSSGQSSPQIQLRIRDAEKTVAIHKKAYAASLADVKRLCPDRISLLAGDGSELRAQVDDLTTNIADSEQEIKAIQEWISQVPDGADEAKRMAREVIQRNDAFNNVNRTCLGALKDLAGESSS